MLPLLLNNKVHPLTHVELCVFFNKSPCWSLMIVFIHYSVRHSQWYKMAFIVFVCFHHYSCATQELLCCPDIFLRWSNWICHSLKSWTRRHQDWRTGKYLQKYLNFPPQEGDQTLPMKLSQNWFLSNCTSSSLWAEMLAYFELVNISHVFLPLCIPESFGSCERISGGDFCRFE